MVDRFRRVLDAFPDMRGETTSMVVEGNLLVQETTWRGRHTVPLKLPGYDNVAPTNELMTMHLVTYLEFRRRAGKGRTDVRRSRGGAIVRAPRRRGLIRLVPGYCMHTLLTGRAG